MDTNMMKQENMTSGIKYAEMVLTGLEGIGLVLDGIGADKKYNDLQVEYYKKIKSLFAESLLEML